MRSYASSCSYWAKTRLLEVVKCCSSLLHHVYSNHRVFRAMRSVSHTDYCLSLHALHTGIGIKLSHRLHTQPERNEQTFEASALHQDEPIHAAALNHQRASRALHSLRETNSAQRIYRKPACSGSVNADVASCSAHSARPHKLVVY